MFLKTPLRESAGFVLFCFVFIMFYFLAGLHWALKAGE